MTIPTDAVSIAISMGSNEITASIPVTVESFFFVFVGHSRTGVHTVAGVSSIIECFL